MKEFKNIFGPVEYPREKICDMCHREKPGCEYISDAPLLKAAYGKEEVCLCPVCYAMEWGCKMLEGSVYQHLHPYHHGPKGGWMPLKEKYETNDTYFGLELEFLRFTEKSLAIKLLHELDPDETLFVLEQDSSLTNGLEIVTHPITFTFDIYSFPIEEICQIVTLCGGEANEETGLHKCQRTKANLYFLRDASTSDIISQMYNKL